MSFIVRTIEMGNHDEQVELLEPAVARYREVEKKIGQFPYLEGVELWHFWPPSATMTKLLPKEET